MGKISRIIQQTFTDATIPNIETEEPAQLQKKTKKHPSARKALDFWFQKAREAGYKEYMPEYSTKHFGQMKHWLESCIVAGKTQQEICNHIETVISSWQQIRQDIKDDFGKPLHLDNIPTFEQYMRYRRKIDALLTQTAASKIRSGTKKPVFEI